MPGEIQAIFNVDYMMREAMPVVEKTRVSESM